jgi:hypothetical protein
MKKITFKTPIDTADGIEHRELIGYDAGTYKGFCLIVNRSPLYDKSWQVCEFTTGRKITSGRITSTRQQALIEACSIIDVLDSAQRDRARMAMSTQAINKL